MTHLSVFNEYACYYDLIGFSKDHAGVPKHARTLVQTQCRVISRKNAMHVTIPWE